MNLNIQSTIATGISTLSLFVSLANYLAARTKTREENVKVFDQLLDEVFDLLFGREGYETTSNTANLEQARLKVIRALKLIPHSPRGIEFQGHLYYAEGNKSLAEEFYKRSIRMDSKRDTPYNSLGRCFKGEKAIQYLEKAIALDPNNAIYHANVGLMYFNINKFDLAEKYYKKAILIKPKYATAHHKLAKIYMKQTKYDLARKELELAIEADPFYVDAMVELGTVMMSTFHQDAEGLAWFAHASKVNPQDDFPSAMLAAIYADRKQPKEAMIYAEKAMALNPKRRFDGDSFAALRSEMNGLLKSLSK